MIQERDKCLLKKLNSGMFEGGKAFSELYELYAPKCRSFVLAMTKDENIANDITHDIFIKVWLKRDVVAKVDSFSSYLFRMIRNAVLDYYESNAINRKYMNRQESDMESFGFYTEEKVRADDLQLIIFNAVNAMPEQRRRIFSMSRYKGLSNGEIANILGINIRTVENHITNALADIRAVLSNI